MLEKCRLMGIDKCHAFGRGIAAGANILTSRKRPDTGKKSLRHELHHPSQPIAVGSECRMHIEAVAPARTRLVGCCHRRIAIGHEYDAGKISMNERLERRAQPGQVTRSLALDNPP